MKRLSCFGPILLLLMLSCGQLKSTTTVFELSSVGEILPIIKNKHKTTVCFIGYSSAGYENQHELKKILEKTLSKLSPSKHIILSGGSAEGIGVVYSLAKVRGFETLGIISSLSKTEHFSFHDVDHLFVMEDSVWGGYLDQVSKKLSLTSQSIIEASDEIVAIGGGEISYVELSEAKRRGIKISYYPAEMNHQKAIERALKQNKTPPSDFKGKAYELSDLRKLYKIP